MLCDKYKEALIVAAASGAALPIPLREHMNACTRCRATFAAEEKLFAAIASSLRERANSRYRASFASRVEAALDEQPRSRRFIAPKWALVSAAAVLACVGFGAQEFRQRVRAPQSALKTAPALERATLGPEKTAIATLGRSSIFRGLAKSDPRNTQAALHVMDEPEVLVPPDEREAFGKFVASLPQREGVAQALLHPAAKSEEESFPMELIQIAQLEIKPLEPQDDAQDLVEK
jgi:hypothetical protein